MGEALSLQDLCFVGLNGHVVALDRYDGSFVWRWRAPRSRTTYTSLMLDGDRLLVSVHGYLYCLDPMSGTLQWINELKGYGVGVTSFASIHGSSVGDDVAAFIAEQRRRRRNAASTP